MAENLRKTDRTTITRHTERGSYDRDLAYAILDEGLIAHVGLDDGRGVMVVPMAYARLGDELVLHGAVASRWLSSFDEGRSVSICVTLLDGLVLARSAFSHSMNYRSVVLFGQARTVTDRDVKRAAFQALLDHQIPGRWEDCRQPDDKESDATVVLSLAIDEASVKLRAGPPKDTAKDLTSSHWSGVLPLRITPGPPRPDTGSKEVPIPEYVLNYRRPGPDRD